MGDMAMESLRLAFGGFMERDTAVAEKVFATNDEIAKIGDNICNYLIRVSGTGISLQDEKKVAAVHNNVGDIIRISELADNFTKYTNREVAENLTFSPVVVERLTEFHEMLKTQYGYVKTIVLDKDFSLMKRSDELEETIDNLRRDLVADHIARMERGDCRPENNAVFINLVSNMERIGDHLSYIAHSVDGIY